jgi:hypothetical protein
VTSARAATHLTDGFPYTCIGYVAVAVLCLSSQRLMTRLAATFCICPGVALPSFAEFLCMCLRSERPESLHQYCRWNVVVGYMQLPTRPSVADSDLENGTGWMRSCSMTIYTSSLPMCHIGHLMSRTCSGKQRFDGVSSPVRLLSSHPLNADYIGCLYGNV